MRFGQLVLPLIIAASSLASSSYAEDDDRMARMQQTIQELTLQLGDAIRENAALRRQLDGHHHDPMPTEHHCEPQLHQMPVAPHAPMQPAQPLARTPQPAAQVPASQPAPIACNIAELEERLDQFNDATTRASTLNNWVSDHGGKCSRSQLIQLRAVANKIILSDDAMALIDYYMTDAR